jgi:hypothetical protein
LKRIVGISLATLIVSTVSLGFGSDVSASTANSVPSATTFQSEVAKNMRSAGYDVPSGVSCNMPNKWTSGTTFYCTILGMGLSIPIERVRAKVTSTGAALKGPSLAPACEADVATMLTAVAAFSASNPKVTPTKALILGVTDHGPFLGSWPNYAPIYAISLSAAGKVLVAIPSSAQPVAASVATCHNHWKPIAKVTTGRT